MGGPERFGVLLLVDVHFHLGTEGRSVRETHRERKRRKVGGALLKVGLLSTTTVAALAFASAARAEDQPAPPPLLLAKSATIAPEEPDAEADGAAAVPIEVVSSTEEDVAVVVPLDEEKPAKRLYEKRARPVSARVVTPRHTRRPVISVSRAAGSPVPKREAVKPAAHKALSVGDGWYQVVRSQYRPVEQNVRPTPLTHVARVEERALVRGLTPARSEPLTAPIICASLAEKCLELCPSDASYNGSWNGPAIGRCISTSELLMALEKVHQIITAGLLGAGASAQTNAAEPRYQCGGPQYHDGICADGAHIAVRLASEGDTAAGGHPARFVAEDTPSSARAVVDGGDRQRLGSVLGVAERRTHADSAVKVRAPLASVTGSPNRRAAVARPVSAATADKPFDDWFLRSVLALMGIAVVGVVLAILFELDGTGNAATALRSRIGSRGLSATHIALRARARPPGDIHYRE